MVGSDQERSAGEPLRLSGGLFWSRICTKNASPGNGQGKSSFCGLRAGSRFSLGATGFISL